MAAGRPRLLRGAVRQWPAVSKWTREFLVAQRPIIHPHAPITSQVRMHSSHRDQPLAKVAGVNWTRPFDEHELRTDRFFDAKELAYMVCLFL